MTAGRSGTKDPLLIGKAILRDCRRRQTKPPMAQTDYKKFTISYGATQINPGMLSFVWYRRKCNFFFYG